MQPMRRGLIGVFVGLGACGTGSDGGRADEVGSTVVGPTSTDGPVPSDSSSSSEGGTAIATSSAPASTSDSTSSTNADTNADTEPSFDLGIIPDVPPADCTPCEITLMTTQSNRFTPLGADPLLITADLDGDLVFGMAEADAGRIAFSGDGNVIYREGTCPLWEWLGGTPDDSPRVLCIGADWPCHGVTGTATPFEINALDTYPGQLDYGGLTLPPAYEGDPEALRTDYDLVVYISVLDFATGGWDADPTDVDTLEAFARDEGGGLYFVGEYWGGGMGQPQLDSLNAMTAPFDIAFDQQSLAWGPAGAVAELDCFPTPAG